MGEESKRTERKEMSSECSICSLGKGEKILSSPFVPTMCWLETSKTDNGLIEMKFGYGDDFEHIFYYPKYCPECGRKVVAR